jgi:hypothetical protein
LHIYRNETSKRMIILNYKWQDVLDRTLCDGVCQ